MYTDTFMYILKGCDLTQFTRGWKQLCNPCLKGDSIWVEESAKAYLRKYKI